MSNSRTDLTRLAVVYLRQSAPGQVRDHVVATQEQYRLREIPERLGFSDGQILVVDDDLGVSGQTISGRRGMLRVLELLEQGKVACVVVRDITGSAEPNGTRPRPDRSGLRRRRREHRHAREDYDPTNSSDQLFLGFQRAPGRVDRANIVATPGGHRQRSGARVSDQWCVPTRLREDHRFFTAGTRVRHTSGHDSPRRPRANRPHPTEGTRFGGVLAVVRFPSGSIASSYPRSASRSGAT